MTDDSLDLATIRERLTNKKGRQFWRSLNELAETETFREILRDEFPRQLMGLEQGVDRRQFLKLMGASLALAGLTACGTQPKEEIVPYVEPPEQIVPGNPLYYATAVTLGGYAQGVLVESHMGRPTKVEGNPDHPASLGATDIFAQASVLGLYDPDRSETVLNAGQISTWENFLTAFDRELQLQQLDDGAGLRILTETVTSPTLASQLQAILEQFPSAQWHQYEPVNRDNARAGAEMAFGEDVNAVYRFDQADVILSLDGDLFSMDPGRVRYARDFSGRRRVREDKMDMNRLYAVESTPTLVGAMADHRMPLRPSEIEGLARAFAQELGVAGVSDVPALDGELQQWIQVVARDLQEHAGSSLVVTGEWQRPVVHALVHAINDVLGNVGSTVVYTQPVEENPVNQTESLRELVDDMEAGNVQVLVMLGGNPVYNAPADMNFEERLSNVNFRVHLSLSEDETSRLAHWHIPATHELESWTDARAYDGTATIIQPLIAPLYDGRSPHEVLAVMLGNSGTSAHDIVRDYWQQQYDGTDFTTFWRRSLHDGYVADTAFSSRSVSVQLEGDASIFGAGDVRVRRGWKKAVAGVLHPLWSMFGRNSSAGPQQKQAADAIEITFRPDPTIWDGRFANNGWLQELPKPLTKLTWDNAAFVSPAMAERLGLQNEQMVDLSYRGNTLRMPAWIWPGHPDGAVTVHLGYGRRRAGQVGTGAGFDTYQIRSSDAPWFDAGLELRGTGDTYRLATTQDHHSMEGRNLVRVATIDEFREDPEYVHHDAHEPGPEESLYPQFEWEGYNWGMGIDLTVCTGCNACVAACQAENNIAVVGKDQVLRGREMHWIRIDRYYEGSLDNPRTYQQPLPCMHCEKAPCEPVCPVAATVHSKEGLNQMIYNRCVGTRYCSNNCPYKVRRFNFLKFTDYEDTPVLDLLQNPDVTVRDRGVMEKCSYCVQRINLARIDAKKEDRQIRDEELMTACQQVCPTQAIVFGDISRPDTAVSQVKAQPHNYGLLAELGTRPRTTYLGGVRNPNPELEA